MAEGIIDMEPDALRAAGQEFLSKVQPTRDYGKQVLGLMEKLKQLGTVDGTVMPTVQAVLDELGAAVKTVQGEVDLIANNIEAVGNAFVRQANATQDADETAAKQS